MDMRTWTILSTLHVGRSTGSQGRARIEKKTIRQHYNMTPASAEAEAGLFFSSLLLYHSKYIQKT